MKSSNLKKIVCTTTAHPINGIKYCFSIMFKKANN